MVRDNHMIFSCSASGWRPIRGVFSSDSVLHARLETLSDLPSLPVPDPPLGRSSWIVASWVSLSRRSGSVVLERALHPWRVVCLTDFAVTVFARCFAGFSPASDLERELIHLSACADLLSGCVEGLPDPPARPDPRVPWSEADASFWASFACPGFGSDPVGEVWTGHRDGDFPSPGPVHGASISEEIPLPSCGFPPRALPRSSLVFGDCSLPFLSLSRWLSRFARARSRRAVFADGFFVDVFERGAPEGGALGTIVVSFAVLSVEGLDPCLYRYDFERHSLLKIDVPVAPLIFSAMQSYGDSVSGTPALVACLSVRIDRMGAKYSRMALSVSLLNAGVVLGAASRAAELEDLFVRPCGRIDAPLWQSAFGVDPLIEPALCVFSLSSQAGPA